MERGSVFGHFGGGAEGGHCPEVGARALVERVRVPWTPSEFTRQGHRLMR